MMNPIAPNDKHHAYRLALTKVLDQHKSQLSALEMLAITAHLVGQLIALQDQTRITADGALELVRRNIEAGNLEVLHMIEKSEGTA